MPNVNTISENDLDEWQSYVDAHPRARAMHHAGWYRVLGDAFSVERFFFLARNDDGKVCGVLPAYLSRSTFTGTHLASLDDGFLADDVQVSAALFAAAIDVRDRLRAKYFLLRTGEAELDLDEPSAKRATVRRIIDTHLPADELFKLFSSYIRRDVRRAEKRGYAILNDMNLDHLDGAFYDEYAKQMHGLGTPVFGRKMMTALKTGLGPERLRLYMVEHEGKLVGGMLCIVAPSQWMAMYAAMDHKYAMDYANYLLYWHAMNEASRNAAPELDLGRNTPGSGVYKFKEKWAGQNRHADHLYFVAPGGPSNVVSDVYNGVSTKQRVWMKLPLGVANKLGPALRRGLPFG